MAVLYQYCDVHAVGQQSTVETLVYNRCYGNQATVECDAANNMADARGKHHVTCYKDDATVARQRMRAKQRHDIHHVTQQ
jgi:hypothetical protein